jgi:hypothetical protein
MSSQNNYSSSDDTLNAVVVGPPTVAGLSLEVKTEAQGVPFVNAVLEKRRSLFSVTKPEKPILIFADRQKLDLRGILENRYDKPLNYETFRNFCSQMWATEEPDFWKAVARIQSPELVPDSEVIETALSIFETYLETNSPNLINVSYQTIESLNIIKSQVLASQFEVDRVRRIFDAAQKEVYELMSFSLLPVFKNKYMFSSLENAMWWRNKQLSWKQFFSYPDPVNEADTRTHAFCSWILVAVNLYLMYQFNNHYLSFYIVYGFLVRVLCGPKLDPQAYIVILFLRPLLADILKFFPHRYVTPTRPKRFAQFVGFLFSTAGTIAEIFEQRLISTILWSMLGFFSLLLCMFDFCAACFMYSVMVKYGIIQDELCKECMTFTVFPLEHTGRKSAPPSPTS